MRIIGPDPDSVTVTSGDRVTVRAFWQLLAAFAGAGALLLVLVLRPDWVFTVVELVAVLLFILLGIAAQDAIPIMWRESSLYLRKEK